jgi:hypothetical protein
MSIMDSFAIDHSVGSSPVDQRGEDVDGQVKQAPNGLHFEQLTVPGLGSGPLLPDWVRKLFRRTPTRA